MATISRRNFLAASLASAALPAIATASKTDSEIVIGQGDYRYRVHHDWAQLPSQFSWQTTHNVAVDSQGLVYVIHEGQANQTDHPAIFVFDADGNYVRSFGSQLQGGGHGLEVRNENGTDFVYATAYKKLKLITKLDTRGEVVWTQRAPMAAGCYKANEDSDKSGHWDRQAFLPTNFAFLPDGGFLLADGYGAYRIHRYDADANYVSTFGEPGKGDGQFDTPHGIWVDDRDAESPKVVVADRANARLQWFSLDGTHLRTQEGFLLPANIDTHDDLMLVPDLQARVTLLDKQNNVVAHLGDDDQWRSEVMQMKVRSQPTSWRDGKFIHPHDACFDAQGNIYVAEWVGTGRVTKLARV
jgi:outer membrane protein assembly factor BamB